VVLLTDLGEPGFDTAGELFFDVLLFFFFFLDSVF
jgi:hypothetical protein